VNVRRNVRKVDLSESFPPFILVNADGSLTCNNQRYELFRKELSTTDEEGKIKILEIYKAVKRGKISLEDNYGNDL